MFAYLIWGGGNIKWLAEPVLLASKTKEITITPQYGIFFISVYKYTQLVSINQHTQFTNLTNDGFVNPEEVIGVNLILKSTPNSCLIGHNGKTFMYIKNSFGEKLSNIVADVETRLSIYKLADIQ